MRPLCCTHDTNGSLHACMLCLFPEFSRVDTLPEPGKEYDEVCRVGNAMPSGSFFQFSWVIDSQNMTWNLQIISDPQSFACSDVGVGLAFPQENQISLHTVQCDYTMIHAKIHEGQGNTPTSQASSKNRTVCAQITYHRGQI